MSLLIMIRHGLTEWNIDHRLQGHADLPLSDDGRRQVQSWRLPDKFLRYRWLTSPLRRAVETATLLKGEAPPADERLKEMSWGRWEGYTVDDLRARVTDLEDQIFRFRIQKSMGQLEAPGKARDLRRDLARINTILREKEHQAAAKEVEAGR